MVTVVTQQLGNRRPLLADWSFQLPPEWNGRDGEPFTLAALIRRIVGIEVAGFHTRQHARATHAVMSQRAIEDQADRGAVRPALQSPARKVDIEEAVSTALQAFEDGIYLVIIDGEEQRDLAREVRVTPDSTITFIRLVMLAGA